MRLAVSLGLARAIKSIIARRRKRRQKWARQWLLKRENSFFNTPLKELKEQDEVSFANFLRMDSITLDITLQCHW